MESSVEKEGGGEELLVTDLLVRWLSATELRVKESTYAKYSNLIYLHLIPGLGKYPAKLLRPAHCEAFVAEKLSVGHQRGEGGLSSKTVRDMLAILRAALRFAGEAVPQETVRGIPVLRTEYKRVQTLSRAEQAALEQVLIARTDPCRVGVLLSLYTGLRIGELCALRWRNLSLEGGYLYVTETVQRIQDTRPDAPHRTKLVFTPPKSASSMREIPIPTSLIAILYSIRVENPDAFLLTGSAWECMEPRTCQNRFKRYLSESGLRGVTFHTLRHTFATRCIELGFDPKCLSELLGHANISITMDRYVHASLAHKQRQMNRLRLLV